MKDKGNIDSEEKGTDYGMDCLPINLPSSTTSETTCQTGQLLQNTIQPLIALKLEDAFTELGHHSVGIASNMYQAFMLDENVDMAFVDVNLEDGLTGPIVGRTPVEADVAVLFMTSYPVCRRPPEW